MERHSLNEREEQILHAAVQCYITTAEPVGSRTIVKRFGLDLSPATVRNVMADLEETGYLEQVHTSSGRVPTDQGYRYYVNHLMRIQELTLAERSRIEIELSRRLNDADEILRHASQLLALISYQTGLVSVPEESHAEVRHIEIMPVTPARAAVLIADSYGRVHTVMVAIEEALDPEELSRLNRFMNESLRGVHVDEMSAAIQAAMRNTLDENHRLAEHAARVLNLLPMDRPVQLYLEGATQLFEQPEFRDIARAREVFGVLEERGRLVDLLRMETSGEQGPGATKVVIGSETRDPGFKEISVVASPYHVGNRPVGMLAVLGPRRMQYPRLTALVGYTAGMLSRFLTSLAR